MPGSEEKHMIHHEALTPGVVCAEGRVLIIFLRSEAWRPLRFLPGPAAVG
jgi:hypothetical protein